VLIVGGGDGGSAEELLKHASMQSSRLAEIDASVVEISRKYLFRSTGARSTILASR
jgi:spermidine synthase